MYTRTLLFNRYSRFAALYSLLETGRQPSFGGKGFAIADAHASNDVVIIRVTDRPFWRNDTSLLRCGHRRRKPLRRQLLQQRLRLLQIARIEPLREPAVNRSKQFARPLDVALVAPRFCLLLTRDRKRFCFKPSQSRPELVAHYVAGAAGGGKLLAEFVERSPVIVYNRDDVALRLAHRWQLPKQDDRLTVADQ